MHYAEFAEDEVFKSWLFFHCSHLVVSFERKRKEERKKEKSNPSAAVYSTIRCYQRIRRQQMENHRAESWETGEGEFCNNSNVWGVSLFGRKLIKSSRHANSTRRNTLLMFLRDRSFLDRPRLPSGCSFDGTVVSILRWLSFFSFFHFLRKRYALRCMWNIAGIWHFRLFLIISSSTSSSSPSSSMGVQL